MTQCPTCGSPADRGGVCQQCGTAVAPTQGSHDQQPQASKGRQHQRRGRRSGHRFPLPTGVKVLCGLLVASGVGALLLGVQLQSLSQTATAYGARSTGGALGLVGLLAVVFGAGELVTAFGLWTRKSWGWTAGMAVAGCGVLTSFLLLTGSALPGIVGMGYNVGIGWYLYGKRWLFAGQKRQSRGAGNRQQPHRRRQ